MDRTKDVGLEALLSLDGEVFRMDNGYWTKFEVKRITSTPEIPHGIRYNLTLHDKSNRRVLGFDNAHAVKPKRRKHGARRLIWDHEHHKELVEPYEFESPVQLMEGFWKAVDEIMSS